MKLLRLIVSACLLPTFLFSGCNQDAPPTAGQNAASAGIVTVGVTPTPHMQILEAAKPVLEKQGYQLKIVQYTDNTQPNVALNQGEIDANFLQSLAALDAYNEKNESTLAATADVCYEFTAIYPGKSASLEALVNGGKLLIPDGAVNESRALRLLESSGLISLSTEDAKLAVVDDISENPQNLLIQKQTSSQLATALVEANAAVIPAHYAIQAGLNAQTGALAVESLDAIKSSSYQQVLAVRAGDENRKELKALAKALQSEEVKTYIKETYAGAILPKE